MTRDARGLGGAWTKYQRHATHAPSPDLARHVERYWVVSWDYREPYRQLIVPFPNVHLTFQDGGATVNGVFSGHQTRVLKGRSGVFGVAFRPGCFRPFLGASVSTITDRSIDAREIFGPGLPDAPDVAEVEGFLRARLPRPDPKADEAAEIVALIAAEPQITRVDALADELGTSVRRLQRLFSEYVGVGPKWVIRRYRLREATERMGEGNWAALAAELGYADQAHFARDFKDMFGEPPTWYAERC
ncbi:helix-turn-helix domain-containing protein [Saccharopolyspora elongata]|uniref:AraC family transcriptional regulator n=1 Tax=Saccharopolyspora elongata TaxID=2530387 RepID=A0A4V2YLV3_9PSEU|nr:helix-turn-helix domain-containing protein [Saccharopolyspora elongata]TDD47917.1 AraC family transcriptional regulator [Saccharopolyspora elongata]